MRSDVVGAVYELDVVVVEAERTTQDHVKTERVARELQQTWKRSAQPTHEMRVNHNFFSMSLKKYRTAE